MSQNTFTKPLSLTVRSSLQKWLIVLIPHTVTSIVVISVDVFSLWMKLILFSAIIFSAIFYSRKHLFLNNGNSIVDIHQDSMRNWLLTSTESMIKGERVNVVLLPSSFIGSLLIVLDFKDSIGRRYTAFITPDCYSNNDFRRLRVRLNYSNRKNS